MVVVRSDLFEFTLLVCDLRLYSGGDWVFNSAYSSTIVVLGWEHDVVLIQRHLRG